MSAAPKQDPERSVFAEYDYSNFYYGAGDDPLNLLGPFSSWYKEALPAGYYLYSEPLSTAPGTEVQVRNRKTGEIQELLNLASYNYLGISYRDEVKEAAIEATRKYGLGASGSPILSGTLDVHNELDAGGRRLQGQGSGDPLPDRLQRERRVHLRAHALGRHHRLRPVLARVDRGRRHPGQVEDGLLPPQQPARPRAEARGRAAARSWSWSRASTRWTATSACCPRSSRSRSATARAS